MEPLHPVRDEQKVEQLAISIKEKGWEGAPLVVWRDLDQLLTGTHRYAAVRSLGWSDEQIPIIDITEVFAEAGLNFEQAHKSQGYPYHMERKFLNLLSMLPQPIRRKYGFDWH